MPTSVLRERDPHTRAVLHALRGYLRASLPTLLATYGAVTYADGFAGPGVYADGAPGAPVIARREMVAALRAGNGSGGRLVLVEADERRLTRLGYEVAVNGVKDQRVHASYLRGECDSTLIPALAETAPAESAPAGATFTLLDGRGAPPPFETLAALGAREASEVLLTVDGRHRDLLGAYRRATLPEAGFAATLAVELIDVRGRRLHLIFATARPRAVETMKTALWSVDPACGVRYRDPYDQAARELDPGPRPDVGPLRDAVLAYVADGDKGTTVNELRGHISRETIYQEALVVGMVRRLIAERQLENRSSGRLAGRSFVGRPRYVTGPLF